MDDLELSLDEIIKKRNIKAPNSSQKFGDRKQQAPVKRLSDGSNPSFPVMNVPDARFKLMSRRGDSGPGVVDARERLQALRSRSGHMRRPPAVGMPLRRTIAGRVGLGAPPLGRLDMFGAAMGVSPLVRTVDNELMHMHARRRPFDWDRPEEDEMDVDMILERSNSMGLNMPIRQGPTFRPSALGPNADLDGITITVHRPASQLAQQPQQSILKRPLPRSLSPPTNLVVPRQTSRGGLTLSQRFNRDRNAEASAKVEALKAQLKATKGEPVVPAKSEGHRIVVSNLVPSVTEEDVQELFGDVGELISAKLVRPGVAEVVYVDLKDALEAVEIYHNRQLDKQPMKCLLVKNQARKNVRPPVELDMSTLRNALHKKPSS